MNVSMRRQFNNTSIQQYSSNRCFPGAYDLPSQGLLASFLIPDMSSFLWSRPQIQEESNWQLPSQSCHYFTSGHVQQISSIACRVHSWEDLVTFSPRSLYFLHLTGTIKSQLVGLWGELLTQVYLISLCPVTKIFDVSSSRLLPSSFGKQIRVVVIACIIWGLSGLSEGILQRGTPVLALDFCLINYAFWKHRYPPMLVNSENSVQIPNQNIFKDENVNLPCDVSCYLCYCCFSCVLSWFLLFLFCL